MDPLAQKIDHLKKLSARTALITALLMAFGLAGVFSNQPGNWLILLFKLLAGFEDINMGMLSVFNGLDIVLLALEGVLMAGLCVATWKISRIGSLAAAILPWAGIALFLATRLAGRSAFMGAIVIISLVMLGGDFPKWMVWLGILCSGFLLAGDFGAGAAPSPLLAGVFAVGYIGCVAWLCAIAANLLQLKFELFQPPPDPPS